MLIVDFFITIGFFGNLLVVTASIRLRLQETHVLFILAVSDILLCLVTMPLTLVEIVNDHWPLGDSVVSCKVSGGFQAVSVWARLWCSFSSGSLDFS